jgi:hypothetical protein
MIISIISYVKIANSDYNYLHSVGVNWNQGPIVSLNTDGDICHNNESNLITDIWPGTTDGCYCTFSMDLYGPLRSGSCRSKRDSYVFCSTVGSRAPVPYTKWKGKTFCGNRVPASYLDLTISPRATSCPSGSRSCGIIDSLNNVMCVPTQTSCPLNDIRYFKSSETVPTDKKYTILNVVGGKVAVSNQNSDGKILNEFKFSELQPCADPNYINSSQIKLYLLDVHNDKSRCQEKVGTIQYDNRYYKVDTYTSYGILNDNNILPLVQTLPLYPNPLQNNREVSLYARNYVGLNPSCLDEIRKNGDTKRFLYDLFKINENITYSLSLSIASMILAIIIFCFSFAYAVMLCCDNNSNSKIFAALFPIILAVITVILTSICASYLKSYTQDDSILQRKECTDNITYEAAINFDSSITSASSLTIFSALLSVLIIILPPLSLIINCSS